jgi:cytochrome c oxidase subunit 3
MSTATAAVDHTHSEDSPHEQARIARFGMVVFLASEAMLFAGLIGGYIVLALSQGQWPPVGQPHLPWQMALVGTAILISSSFTYHFAEVAVKKGGSATPWLFVSLVLGAIFLCIQSNEWFHLIHEENFTFKTGLVYSSNFYILTGFHGFHVTIGAILILCALFKSLAGKFSAESHVFLELAGLYWHFVDVVWIGLYGVLYAPMFIIPFLKAHGY